ncbi:hypothetical protein OROMI_012918 [Orobanche minor]
MEIEFCVIFITESVAEQKQIFARKFEDPTSSNTGCCTATLESFFGQLSSPVAPFYGKICCHDNVDAMRDAKFSIPFKDQRSGMICGDFRINQRVTPGLPPCNTCQLPLMHRTRGSLLRCFGAGADRLHSLSCLPVLQVVAAGDMVESVLGSALGTGAILFGPQIRQIRRATGSALRLVNVGSVLRLDTSDRSFAAKPGNKFETPLSSVALTWDRFNSVEGPSHMTRGWWGSQMLAMSAGVSTVLTRTILLF